MGSDQEKYDELSSYTLSLHDSAFIHQHIADAFAAQSADKKTKPMALAFALIGLYLHVEKGYSGKEVQRAHARLAKRGKRWPKFDIPKNRGDMTVSDALAAKAGEERNKTIDAWCASVWDAYGAAHEQVAILATELLK